MTMTMTMTMTMAFYDKTFECSSNPFSVLGPRPVGLSSKNVYI